MSFLFQSLITYGLPLAAVPIVIHLINLRRRRRIEWAAMEFLVASQRRNRKWVLLRQLLLMLTRAAMVAAVVAMLAGPVMRSEWAGLLGGGRTHHVVLLDDSYSMSDTWAGVDTFDEAKQSILNLLTQTTNRPGTQEVSIVLFSRAAGYGSGGAALVDHVTITPQSLDTIRTTLSTLAASESDAGPAVALDALRRLPEPQPDQSRIVYLFTDFREKDWQENEKLAQLLGEANRQADQVHLVRCGREHNPNVSVTRLEPEAGYRASGVETWMRCAVANHGPERLASVIATVQQDGRELPAIDFGAVDPGEEVTRRFRVVFGSLGWHSMVVRVSADSVEADNTRCAVCNTPDAFPVLLVDGSPEGADGFYVRQALSPGGRRLAGWEAVVERPSYLRDEDDLDRFAAVLLLDVPHLDAIAVEALQEYVSGGGGLAIFLGPSTEPRFFNEQLYKEGAGLAPAPIDTPTQLLTDPDASEADIVVSDSPIFRVFGGQRNSFLQIAKVRFYYSLLPGWSAPDSGDVSVLASLRNGAPLVMEKRLGKGRIVVQNTRIAPTESELGVWSNWSINPAFPVYVNELVGALSSGRRGFPSTESGTRLELSVPENEYIPEVRVFPPGEQPRTVSVAPTDGTITATLTPSAESGVWRAELSRRDGQFDQRLLAVNVPPGEGDLRRIDAPTLASRLPGVDYLFANASDFSGDAEKLAGHGLADVVLVTLLMLLAFEQWFAFRSGYHVRAKAE